MITTLLRNRYGVPAAVALSGLFLTGCGKGLSGSGNFVTKSWPHTGFKRIAAESIVDLKITQGNTYSITASADDNLIHLLNVSLHGDELKVGLKQSGFFSNATMDVEVVLPELSHLENEGTGDVELVDFTVNGPFQIETGGTGDVTGKLTASQVFIEAAGTSSVILTGSCQGLKVDADGTTEVDLSGFTSTDTDIESGGTSTVKVVPSGRLDAEASGVSEIIYGGNPTLGDIDASGGAKVKKR